MSCGIYLIKCTGNGKVYVGQSIEIEKRKYAHFNKLRLGRHRNPHLQNAFNTYGEEAFEHTTLELTPIENLNERELYWINRLNSQTPACGFNLKGGGDSIHTCSCATRAKMSEIRLGRPGKQMSAETRAKISKARQGQKASLETRKKLSQAQRGRPHSKHSAETRAKLSAAAKTRETLKKSNLGRKHSPEARAKISAAAKAREARRKTA
jgi:group I intron endonuclease